MIKYVADQFKLWQYIKRTILLPILFNDTLKAFYDFRNKLKMYEVMSKQTLTCKSKHSW